MGELLPTASQENKGLAMAGDYSEYVNIDVDGIYKINAVGGYLILCDKNSFGFLAEIHHVFGFVEILSQHLDYISTIKDTASKLNVYKDKNYVCLQNKTNMKLTNLYIKSIGRV